MKQKLLNTISEIIKLLSQCDLNSKVKWFEEKQKNIAKLEENGDEFREEMRTLREIISGMGSFLDLPVYPKKESGLSRLEARKKQSELAERLYELTSEVLGLR